MFPSHDRGGSPFVGNDGITARRSLNLLLSDWQNRGILLWTTGFTNQALTSGTEQYELADSVMAVTELSVVEIMQIFQ